jgi:hypothetical protein
MVNPFDTLLVGATSEVRDAIKPPQPAAPAEQTPAEPPALGELVGYRVKLKDCPPIVVPVADARDRLDAVEVYKKLCGVLTTIHPFEVAEVHAPAQPAVA